MNKNAFDFIRNSLNRIADGIASSDGSYPMWDYRALMELIDTLESEYGKKETPASVQPEIIRCKDCKYNPRETWFGCPMAHLSETQRPDTAWCWKGEMKEK